jgi:hypothetical protein
LTHLAAPCCTLLHLAAPRIEIRKGKNAVRVIEQIAGYFEQS